MVRAVTSSASNRAIIWDRLLALADEIDNQQCTVHDLESRLLTIEEGFSSVFDPADHYAEYVAVLFCRALRRRIERAQLRKV